MDATKHQVHLVIPRALWDRIVLQAEAERRSANKQIVVLLEQAVGE